MFQLSEILVFPFFTFHAHFLIGGFTVDIQTYAAYVRSTVLFILMYCTYCFTVRTTERTSSIFELNLH